MLVLSKLTLTVQMAQTLHFPFFFFFSSDHMTNETLFICVHTLLEQM